MMHRTTNIKKNYGNVGIYIWEDNIKIDLKEIRWEGVPWIDLAQDRNK
jgi:hypothetical protein